MKISDWMRHRGALALSSLFFGFLAWFFVHSEQVAQREKILKVQYWNMPAGLTFKTQPPSTVRMDLAGRLSHIRKITPDELVYVVDLSGEGPGPKSHEVNLGRVRIPFEVRVFSPKPRLLRYTLEKIFEKELPILVQYEGALETGYVVKNLKLDPPRIKVSGPESVVMALSQVPLSIPLDGAQKEFTREIKLEGLAGLEAPKSVLATVEIEEAIIRKSYMDVVVKTVGAHKALISPAKAELVVEGAEPLLNQWDPSAAIFIPVEGLKKGSYRLRGQVQSPDGIKLISLKPQSFIVKIVEE